MLSIQKHSSNTRPCQPDADRYTDFFDEYYARFRAASDTNYPSNPPSKELEAVNTPESHSQLEIVLDVTGFEPENITVRLEGNALKVMAFYESKCDVNYPELIQHEIHNERLLHIFQLEKPVLATQVNTKFDNHRLHISLPLVYQAQ